MGKETWTITLADGSSIKELRLNGNNFISTKKVTEKTFTGKLEHVEAESSQGNKIIFENAELVQITEMGSEYWFILRQLTAAEIKDKELSFEFEAMMEAIDSLLMG